MVERGKGREEGKNGIRMKEAVSGGGAKDMDKTVWR